MKELKINETPVRTSRNFNINNIKIKDIEIPTKITEFQGTSIVRTNEDIVITENVSSCNLKYGIGKELIDEIMEKANKKIKIEIQGRTRKSIEIENNFDEENINLIENIDKEDGYRIVNMYLEKDFNDEKFPKKVHKSIRNKVTSEYYQKIFTKYDLDGDTKIENIPIWEFLEIITFGELVNFYEFFSKEYELKNEIKNVFILREVVKLRNAVAHNSCVLCDLDKKDNNFAPDYKIVNYLNNCEIGKETRDNKLSNSRIRQITYTLYMFNEIVTSTGVKINVTKDINDLFYERIILHKEYYNNNELLKSIYAYFNKIIKKHYSVNIEQNSLTWSLLCGNMIMQGKSVLHFCMGTVFIDGALFFFYNAYFNRGLISSIF